MSHMSWFQAILFNSVIDYCDDGLIEKDAIKVDSLILSPDSSIKAIPYILS